MLTFTSVGYNDVAMSTARVVVDLDVAGPTISRHLYGHFAEHLGRCIYGGFWVGEDSPIPNEGGLRLDVVEALRALDVPNLRWPGGCFADDYHWRDGIGPRGDRPVMVNTHWGGVEEDNHFGTHEFMALCELLGADPYVNGNVGSGTVQEMSEWVEYLTRDGDSPDGRACAGPTAATSRGRCRSGASATRPGAAAGTCGPRPTPTWPARYATFLRDHGGNTLYRIAAGAADDDLAWTEALMKARRLPGLHPRARGRLPGDLVPLLHVRRRRDRQEPGHRLRRRAVLPDDGQGGRHRPRDRRAQRGDGRLRPGPAHRAGLRRVGHLVEVEPGTDPGFLHQQNTLRDALVASLHLDVFHKHAARLRMANIAQTVNVLQAMVLTDENGAGPSCSPRPTTSSR